MADLKRTIILITACSLANLAYAQPPQTAPETASIDQASYPVVSVDIAQYQKNDNNTVTDKVTGLMWQQDYKVLSFDEAVEYAKGANIGGYDDWRIPSIKELYSLILFTGVDASNQDMYKVPDGSSSRTSSTSKPKVLMDLRMSVIPVARYTLPALASMVEFSFFCQ